MSWGGGYVTDIAYLSGYYRQQSPTELAVACLLGNVASNIPALYEAMLYLELGCGRGLGALVLAASNPGWHVTGVDFNPAHIAEARQLAAAAGLSNITFHEADLGRLADEADPAIPEADVISMHGVWSWVAAPVQDGIVRLLAAKLRAGGVLHVSYNSLPGWQGGLGLQRLLFEAGSRLAFRSDRQVRAAAEVVKALHAAEARHLVRTPFGDNLVARIEKMPTEYLAHEVHERFVAPGLSRGRGGGAAAGEARMGCRRRPAGELPDPDADRGTAGCAGAVRRSVDARAGQGHVPPAKLAA